MQYCHTEVAQCMLFVSNAFCESWHIIGTCIFSLLFVAHGLICINTILSTGNNVRIWQSYVYIIPSGNLGKSLHVLLAIVIIKNWADTPPAAYLKEENPIATADYDSSRIWNTFCASGWHSNPAFYSVGRSERWKNSWKLAARGV